MKYIVTIALFATALAANAQTYIEIPQWVSPQHDYNPRYGIYPDTSYPTFIERERWH